MKNNTAQILKLHTLSKKSAHESFNPVVHTKKADPSAVIDMVHEILAPLALNDRTGHILDAIEHLEAAQEVIETEAAAESISE